MNSFLCCFLSACLLIRISGIKSESWIPLASHWMYILFHSSYLFFLLLSYFFYQHSIVKCLMIKKNECLCCGFFYRSNNALTAVACPSGSFGVNLASGCSCIAPNCGSVTATTVAPNYYAGGCSCSVAEFKVVGAFSWVAPKSGSIAVVVVAGGGSGSKPIFLTNKYCGL